MSKEHTGDEEERRDLLARITVPVRARTGMTTALTCDTCKVQDCEYRGDDYNTDGDCLASK